MIIKISNIPQLLQIIGYNGETKQEDIQNWLSEYNDEKCGNFHIQILQYKKHYPGDLINNDEWGDSKYCWYDICYNNKQTYEDWIKNGPKSCHMFSDQIDGPNFKSYNEAIGYAIIRCLMFIIFKKDLYGGFRGYYILPKEKETYKERGIFGDTEVCETVLKKKETYNEFSMFELMGKLK